MGGDVTGLLAAALVVAFICAVACAAIANQKGLNPAGWDGLQWTQHTSDGG